MLKEAEHCDESRQFLTKIQNAGMKLDHISEQILESSTLLNYNNFIFKIFYLSGNN
jgi:hypothetical protein